MSGAATLLNVVRSNASGNVRGRFFLTLPAACGFLRYVAAVSNPTEQWTNFQNCTSSARWPNTFEFTKTRFPIGANRAKFARRDSATTGRGEFPNRRCGDYWTRRTTDHRTPSTPIGGVSLFYGMLHVWRPGGRFGQGRTPHRRRIDCCPRILRHLLVVPLATMGRSVVTKEFAPG